MLTPNRRQQLPDNQIGEDQAPGRRQVMVVEEIAIRQTAPIIGHTQRVFLAKLIHPRIEKPIDLRCIQGPMSRREGRHNQKWDNTLPLAAS